MARFACIGVPMNKPKVPPDRRAVLDLGRLLGQRRAFSAHAKLLRRIHDEKLYLPLAGVKCHSRPVCASME